MPINNLRKKVFDLSRRRRNDGFYLLHGKNHPISLWYGRKVFFWKVRAVLSLLFIPNRPFYIRLIWAILSFLSVHNGAFFFRKISKILSLLFIRDAAVCWFCFWILIAIAFLPNRLTNRQVTNKWPKRWGTCLIIEKLSGILRDKRGT